MDQYQIVMQIINNEFVILEDKTKIQLETASQEDKVEVSVK